MFPNKQTEEVKLLDGQLIASTLFLLNLIIAMILLYNQKLNVTEKEPLFDQETATNIALWNKIFAIILLGYFLYVSYVTYEDTKDTERGEDSSIQLFSSSLVFIASLLGLYIILKNYNTSNIPFIEIENPEI